MKKSMKRIVSVILIVGMLFAFTSCAQEVRIRFVDADGNDLDLSALYGTKTTVADNSNNTPAPTETPTEAPTEAPTQAPNPNTDASTADPSKAPDAGASTGMPQSKEEILNFYKAAVNKIKIDKAATYSKKEWQVIDAINIGPDAINSAVVKLAGNFATSEADAKVYVSEKGTDECEHRFPNFILTDYSKVASATCTPKGSNYLIKIVMVDEDTPKKTGSMLGQVTNSVLYWESIEDTLKNDKTVNKVVKEFSDVHVNYKHFTIEAEITPDGKFVSMDHTADVDVVIGAAKILFFNLTNKSGHLMNYCKYRDFKY